jgi:uncharacterized protein YkwD
MLREWRRKYKEGQVVVEPEPEPVEPQQPPEILPPPITEQPPKPEPVETYESVLHKLVNDARRQEDMTELAYDDKLAEIGEAHSIDMQQRNFLSHVNPNGLDSDDRARRAGYAGWTRFGENIAIFWTSKLSSYTKLQVAQKFFDLWWNSPGYKRNILSLNYNREGLGIWIYGNKCWATQNFAKK